MQRVSARFARAVQRHLNTTGHLFENRYHALLVEVDNYFLALLRYIHLNPVRAGLVQSPQHYWWSSHRVYLGLDSRPWVHTDFGLRLFSQDSARARALYQAFVEQPAEPEASMQLAANPKERRVLGSDRFLEQLRLTRPQVQSAESLEALVRKICEEHAVTLEVLRSPGRERKLCQLRALIAARALEARVATLSDVARYLNRSVSTLSRALLGRQNSNMQT